MSKANLALNLETKWLSRVQFIDLMNKKAPIHPNISLKYFFGKVLTDSCLNNDNSEKKNLELVGNVFKNEDTDQWQINVSHKKQTFNFKDNFFVLSIENFNSFEWVTTRLRNIPQKAIKIPLDSSENPTLYIGKISVKSEIPAIYKDGYWQHYDEEQVPELFGKIDPEFSRIFVPFKDVELTYMSYDILCIKNK
ncbi:unnamed protein product [Brachionus calyciflorus]|uniref:Uncharacterized protein n=1 Tax=Brachionus calyciflorus TaxID=104777 RepID=A0A813U665_9BILA|nr:unnamed protein product [Brachionus calyciflorus]